MGSQTDNPFDFGSNPSWEDVEAANEEAERGRLEAIRRGEADINDREAAHELVDQVEELLRRVGEGTSINDVNDEYKLKHRVLGAVLRRLGIEDSNSYRDLWRYYEAWTELRLGTYASRRAYAAELYEPIRIELDKLEFASLAQPVSDRPTGWVQVDEQVRKLRERYALARDTADCQAVGLLCVELLQTLGRTVFDPDVHLPEGQDAPKRDDAKRRISLYVQAVAKGEDHRDVRRVVDPAWALAQSVKHRQQPDRTDAGIAADAAILLVNLVRRLANRA
jgi:hypothetical protein